MSQAKSSLVDIVMGAKRRMGTWDSGDDDMSNALKQTDQEALDVDATDGHGLTPLYCAVVSKQYPKARLLVEAGANPFGQESRSPLLFCLTNLKSGTPLALFTHWLLKRLSSEGEDRRREIKECINRSDFVLQHLCGTSDDDSWPVELMIQHGANVNCGDDNTPLHCAAHKGNLHIAKVLLDNGADVDSRRIDGTTPLHLAVAADQPALVALLVERGASTNALSGSPQGKPFLAHKTPIQFAAFLDMVNCARILNEWDSWQS
ncbi:hypothetical protein [Mollivirus kamchatka]|nr:hypothetical protein [Mollivirus kamchatka]